MFEELEKAYAELTDAAIEIECAMERIRELLSVLSESYKQQ